jgi:hypothetical protein
VQNNRDTVRHKQAEYIGAGNTAAIIDIGNSDNSTNWRLNAVANGRFCVTQVAVCSSASYDIGLRCRVRMTAAGISVSSIGGIVVAIVTVVVTASLELLLKPRTPNMMISVIAVSTAMRLRSKTDRTT